MSERRAATPTVHGVTAFLVAQHRWVVPLLALVALAGIVVRVIGWIGIGPLSTPSSKLESIEGRVAKIEDTMAVVRSTQTRFGILVPLIFCRGATSGERFLAREAVNCSDLSVPGKTP